MKVVRCGPKMDDKEKAPKEACCVRSRYYAEVEVTTSVGLTECFRFVLKLVDEFVFASEEDCAVARAAIAKKPHIVVFADGQWKWKLSPEAEEEITARIPRRGTLRYVVMAEVAV